MIVLGIDPGLSGALAIVSCAPHGMPVVRAVIDVPTVGEGAKRRVLVSKVAEFLTGREIDRCFIERAQAMPDQGSSSGFIYGRAVGALEATVLWSGISLMTAEPSVWKRRFGLVGIEEKKRKKASLELARKLFIFEAGALSFEQHHNRAEAMLIAAWGALKLGIPVRVSGESGDAALKVTADSA